MLCPEMMFDEMISNTENIGKEDTHRKDPKRDNVEDSGNFELSSYRNPKTWKKSITKFFRQQLRSTKSIDGDRPSGSKESFEAKEVAPEQKWQSLGKVFRRQSFVDHWNKSASPQAESSTQTKRLAVRRVLSNYFGKSKPSDKDEK